MFKTSWSSLKKKCVRLSQKLQLTAALYIEIWPQYNKFDLYAIMGK